MAQLALAADLQRAHQSFNLTWRDLADVLSTTERSIYRWKAGASEPAPAVFRRIRALVDLLDLLTATFGSADEARAWLATPLPALANRRPLELLRRGRIEEVQEVLGRIAHGVYA
jgi:putative toxin-antitoxin system antitoxin component (TIGR02293 family)